MMKSSLARIRTIAKKELVEFVRDWRTIMAILVIPLLMFPLLFILFPLLLASEAAELDAIEVEVIVQGSGVPQDLGLMLENASLNITYEPLATMETLAPQGIIVTRGSVRATSSPVKTATCVRMIFAQWKAAVRTWSIQLHAAMGMHARQGMFAGAEPVNREALWCVTIMKGAPMTFVTLRQAVSTRSMGRPVLMEMPAPHQISARGGLVSQGIR